MKEQVPYGIGENISNKCRNNSTGENKVHAKPSHLSLPPFHFACMVVCCCQSHSTFKFPGGQG